MFSLKSLTDCRSTETAVRRSLVSYPKSGRTWIRFALNNVDARNAVKFHHDGFEFNDGEKPALDFDACKRAASIGEGDRIVYLERDPRDVMCSLYHQITGRFQDYFEYGGSISEFIRDPYFGAANLAGFREMWRAVSASPNVLAVSYEDMTADPAGTLGSIARFYEMPSSGRRIKRATRAAEFSNMRKIEDSGRFGKAWLRTRNGHSKVRKGKVGGFVSELDVADIAYLNQVFGIGEGT